MCILRLSSFYFPPFPPPPAPTQLTPKASVPHRQLSLWIDDSSPAQASAVCLLLSGGDVSTWIVPWHPKLSNFFHFAAEPAPRPPSITLLQAPVFHPSSGWGTPNRQAPSTISTLSQIHPPATHWHPPARNLETPKRTPYQGRSVLLTYVHTKSAHCSKLLRLLNKASGSQQDPQQDPNPSFSMPRSNILQGTPPAPPPTPLPFKGNQSSLCSWVTPCWSQLPPVCTPSRTGQRPASDSCRSQGH